MNDFRIVITRILVIRFSSIGDIVLTTPVLRGLKEQLEGEVQLDFLCKETYAPIIEANPFVDNVITIKDRVAEVANYIQDQMYDGNVRRYIPTQE